MPIWKTTDKGPVAVDAFRRVSPQRPVFLALPAWRQGACVQYSVQGREDHMTIPIPLEECIAIEIEEGG